MLVLAGAIALSLLGVVGYMRVFAGNTDRAQDAWNQAMQAMVERFGLTFYPSTGPHDWSGAGGIFRGRHIGFSVVSETERPMRTGVFVQFQRPLTPQVLAELKAQRRFIQRGSNLEVRTSARSEGEALPIKVDELVATLLEGAYDAEITSERMVVTLETRRHNLFNYDMLTDPDRLIAAAITAVDLASILEAADG
jgi:hypothetical protein